MAVHDYFEQVGRFNLLIAKDDLNIGLQFDEVALFSNRYVLDGREQVTTPLYESTVQSPFDDSYFLLEKMFVSKKWDTPTPGQQAKIDKAKRQTILFI